MFSLSVVQGTSELLRSHHPWESSESSTAVAPRRSELKELGNIFMDTFVQSNLERGPSSSLIKLADTIS